MFQLRKRQRPAFTVLAPIVVLVAATGLMAALAAGTGGAAAHAATMNAGDPGTTVVGGHAASEPYPAMASLQTARRGNPDFHFCAASLVSGMYAVTNAHCVTFLDGTPRPAASLHVRIGSHNRLDGGVVVGVAAVLPHASWDWATGPNPVADIALLKLDGFVQLQPIEVAPRLARRGAVARILGWGVTEPSGQAPDIPIMLQELDTRVIASHRCAGGLISAGEICVDNPHGTDGACYGDSGGPVMQKVTANRWQAVGGASRSATDQPFCGVAPTIYTSYPYYRTWMYDVMRTGVVPPAAPGQEPTPPVPGTVNSLQWGIPDPL